MGLFIGLALLAALFLWLTGVGKAPGHAAPEDDVDTPIDEDELSAAERDVRDDRSARPIQDADGNADDDDDWGPGAPGSNRGPLPGIL